MNNHGHKLSSPTIDMAFVTLKSPFSTHRGFWAGEELELMGLPGLASYQRQVDYSSDGAIVVGQEDVISDLISSSYDLIGLLRDLQRSKRQREDHAQQLIHDLQRSQVLSHMTLSQL